MESTLYPQLMRRLSIVAFGVQGFIFWVEGFRSAPRAQGGQRPVRRCDCMAASMPHLL